MPLHTRSLSPSRLLPTAFVTFFTTFHGWFTPHLPAGLRFAFCTVRVWFFWLRLPYVRVLVCDHALTTVPHTIPAFCFGFCLYGYVCSFTRAFKGCYLYCACRLDYRAFYVPTVLQFYYHFTARFAAHVCGCLLHATSGLRTVYTTVCAVCLHACTAAFTCAPLVLGSPSLLPQLPCTVLPAVYLHVRALSLVLLLLIHSSFWFVRCSFCSPGYGFTFTFVLRAFGFAPYFHPFCGLLHAALITYLRSVVATVTSW